MRSVDLLTKTADDLHDFVIDRTACDRAVEVSCVSPEEHAALVAALAMCGRGKLSRYDAEMPSFLTDYERQAESEDRVYGYETPERIA